MATRMLKNWNNYYSSALKIMTDRSINVDTSHRCLLQCPYCTRQNSVGKAVVKQYQVEYGDLRINDAIKMAQTWPRLSFCGQISDPVYHPKMHDLMRALNTVDNLKFIEFHTTGHGKKTVWWEELVDITNSGNYFMQWIFGIDGINQKTSLHRVNQSFDSAFNAMKYVAQNVKDHGEVIWQYIVFEYNEKDIPTAIQMANDYGIKFQLLTSSRFGAPGQNDNPLQPPTAPALKNFSGFSKKLYINSVDEYNEILNEIRD